MLPFFYLSYLWDHARSFRNCLSVSAHKEIEDRVAKAIVLIAGNHMGCFGNVAVFDMRDGRTEMRDSLRRHKSPLDPPRIR